MEDIKQENAVDGATEPSVAETDDVGGCVLRIEELLKQQAEHNKKMQKFSRVRTVAIVAIAVVFVIFAFLLYGTVKDLTVGLPGLIQSTNALVDQASGDLDAVFESVESINFEGINDLISEVSAIDFEGLGASVEALGEGVQAFQRIMEALSNPFGLIS